MFNAIDEIKRQYIYTVQPIKLFETTNSKATQKNLFETTNNQSSKQNAYNLLHPNISNSNKGNKLDTLF